MLMAALAQAQTLASALASSQARWLVQSKSTLSERQLLFRKKHDSQKYISCNKTVSLRLPNSSGPHKGIHQRNVCRRRSGARWTAVHCSSEGGIESRDTQDETLETRRPLWIVGLLILSAIAWLQNVFSGGLVDDTEPLFVEAARQMILTGDWITPQFNAQARFDKPALIYWLMAASASIFGGNVWAYRLPSALAAMLLLVGLVITTHTFGVHVPSADRGDYDQGLQVNYGICSLAAALSFALSLEVSVWGSTGLSDMLLTSTMSGCLLSFFWAYAGQHKQQQWGYLGAALFMGMAILAKGPVGALLPVLVCFIFLLYTGELGQMALKEVPWLKGIAVVLVVNLPWYALMLSRHGSMFISTFFGYHNIERYTKGVNHHGGRPWWYAIAVVAVMYFPWSFLLPRAIARVAPWKYRENWLAAPRQMRLLLFALVWLAVNFTFFWLSSSQLPSYYLPIAPAAALMASSELCRKSEGLSDSESVRMWSKSAEFAAYGLLYCVVSVLLLGLPSILNSSGDVQLMAMAVGLKQSGIHFIGGGVMALASFLFAMQTIWATLRSNRTVDKFPSYFVHALAMGVFLLGFFNPMYRIVDSVRQQPLRELCFVARSMQDPLLMVGTRMPSVVFYSRRPVAFFDSDEEAVNALRHETNERISSYLVFVDANSWHLAEGEVVAKKDNYLLLRIQRQAS